MAASQCCFYACDPVVDANDFTHVRVTVTATMDGWGAGCPDLINPGISIVGGAELGSAEGMTVTHAFDISDGYTNATYTFTAYFTANYWVGEVLHTVSCEQTLTINVTTCD